MEPKALIKWVQAQDDIKKRQILSPSGSYRGMHLYCRFLFLFHNKSKTGEPKCMSEEQLEL